MSKGTGTAPTPTDGGSAAVELVLLTPLLVLILMTVVALGRLADARLVVADAAHQAARAASIARTETEARTSARSTVHAALHQAGATCSRPAVALTTSGLKPGTTATVKVTCTVALGDLTHTGMPGRMTLQDTAYSPVDVHRSAP
ncbi:TadE/TadG family type IV pilus assembly protein [Streptomyces luomodiensis]|uniref:TadE/TadG family type IV pilus assembly protein n=1 Tax=Streptomyces luomodiensis TaxID=3026192 RepID=A0ABY9USN2_9ACTN|nr:TadE/TadG family type IV pilus assembly protein [Streptomyces sp. SCA4-21]WNE95539.1 TadE/TadG family type IV pilus assembly protein [Streptomyces sp. SCA4-21]